MKQNIIFSYVYDFLSTLLEKEAVLEQVETIILFGSVARGDFDEKSDVDLFLNIKKEEQMKRIQAIVTSALFQFETRAEKTWNLRNISLPIKIITGKLNLPEWNELQREIANTGLILYGKYEKIPEKLKQTSIISYSLNKLSQKDKMQLLRTLYGYTTRKEKKNYIQKGIVNTVGGKKTSINQILVTTIHAKKILEVLNNYNTPYTIKEFWVEL